MRSVRRSCKREHVGLWQRCGRVWGWVVLLDAACFSIASSSGACVAFVLGKKAGNLFHRLPGYWKVHGESIKETCNDRIFSVLAVWEMVL